MLSLNQTQIQSLKNKIEKQFSIEGLSFNDQYEETERGITYQIIERSNHKLKIIYVIVAQRMDGQFDKFGELEKIASRICGTKAANLVCYTICSFDGNEAKYIPPDYQIECK